MDGSINFIGSLSGSIDEGGGGGSNVSITPILESGTKIAEYTIDDENGELYAPSNIVNDIQLNTTYPSDYDSIVNENGIALINLYPYAKTVKVDNDINNVLTELRTVEQDVNSMIAHWGDKQDKLTAGTNITIDANNVISASGGGGGINYSTNEQDTGILWVDNRHVFQKCFIFTSDFNFTTNYVTLPFTVSDLNIDMLIEGKIAILNANVPYTYYPMMRVNNNNLQAIAGSGLGNRAQSGSVLIIQYVKKVV